MPQFKVSKMNGPKIEASDFAKTIDFITPGACPWLETDVPSLVRPAAAEH